VVVPAAAAADRDAKAGNRGLEPGLAERNLPPTPTDSFAFGAGDNFGFEAGNDKAGAGAGSGGFTLKRTNEPMQNSHIKLAGNAFLCAAAAAAVASLPAI